MKPRLPLLLTTLGILTAIGIFLRPSIALAPAGPATTKDPQSPIAALAPVESAGSLGDRLVKQARDCVYALEIAKAERSIIELQRSTRSGEQLEVESQEVLNRARLYADRLGAGLASLLGDGRWAVTADGMPVLVVDEAIGAVTTYEGQPLCP